MVNTVCGHRPLQFGGYHHGTGEEERCHAGLRLGACQIERLGDALCLLLCLLPHAERGAENSISTFEMRSRIAF